MSDDESDRTDAALIDALRALGRRLDPPPDSISADATAAYGERTVGTEAATLSYDSLLDDDALRSGVPPSGQARHLRFVSHDLSVELDVGGGGLTGHLVPPTAAAIELRWPGGSTGVVADDQGSFAVTSIPTGPVSLRCRPHSSPAAPSVVTDWVTL